LVVGAVDGSDIALDGGLKDLLSVARDEAVEVMAVDSVNLDGREVP
jgi:hypothetical protein